MTSSLPNSLDHLGELPRSGEGGRALIRQARFLAAMFVAGIIFWYFGPWAVPIRDPDGPISLLLVDQGVIAMAELLALAVVVSGLTVAICGAGSAERGPLGVAVGLATLGLHGSQMDILVLDRLTAPHADHVASDLFPTWGLVAETCLWLALIAVGFVVGRWVDSWFEPDAAPEPKLSATQLPEYKHSFGTVAIASVLAWFGVSYTLGGLQDPLLKGQIYFSVWLSFLFGTLVAHWIFVEGARIWLLAAIAVVALAAYAFGGPSAAQIANTRDSGAYLTLPLVCRPLPIEYAAMGSIGVLMENDALGFLRALFGLRPAEAPAATGFPVRA